MTNEIQEKLIDELGLADLPAEKKDQLIIKMTEVVLKRIFLETMEKLTDSDQDEYTKMIDDNVESEKLEEFLRSRITGYEDMVTKIVADFMKEMKEVE